jgi:acetylornithine/N-succinyldiaminopimelate aminotransferase
MSATPSDSPSGPNGLVETAPAGDASAAGGPLDFSGASLFFPDNSIASAPCGSAPTDSPEAAAKEAEALADALCAKISPVTFGDRVFLASSEREVWRCAIEMTRRYHAIVGRPKRRKFIVCVGASEGMESASLGFESDDEVVILKTDDHAALQAAVDVKTAGILIAPVRTRAGLEIVPGELLVRLRETADEYGLILAFDETFCGFGRSGMMWAHEWTGVTPDLMIATYAPVETPPLTALVVTQRVARGAVGRPMLVDQAALLAGHVLMDALSTPDFLERVQNRSWRLEDRLAALFYKRQEAFAAVTGLGLMQGLTCLGEAESMRARLAERGLLTRAAGSVLGLFPPLTVEESDIDAAVSCIDRICAREE